MDGILNLNKPRGWTSHDVVAHVRRVTGIRKVGHAGTLDPMATGVLLVCLGRATRITEYLMASRKLYRAEMRLGISTDSHDADGQVTATAPVKVNRAQVEKALSRFRGNIEQVPPMVSAIKQDGQPLYRLARRGVTVERAARPVVIHELKLTAWHPPSFSVDVSCSHGTYIRALARDLGEQLGCGAHVTVLVRLASGEFTINQAIELAEFTALASTGDPQGPGPHSERQPAKWKQLVIPLDAGLKQFPAITLGRDQNRRIRTGQPLSAKVVDAPRDQLCRAYALCDGKSELVALLRFDDNAQMWRPHKVFYPL